MKISGNEVNEITHDEAKVGCTRVTRLDVEALLAEMNKVPIKEVFDFKITSQNNSITDYVSFRINEDHDGWASPSYNHGAKYYGGNPTGFANVLSLSLCLSLQKAEKLMRFLAEKLGFFVEKDVQKDMSKDAPKYVIEVRYKVGLQWSHWTRYNYVNIALNSFSAAVGEVSRLKDCMGDAYEYRVKAI